MWKMVLCAAVLLVSPFSVTAQSSQPREVTFSKDVAPILYQNCVECHRPGEVAPFSLLTYQNARPWAKSIRQAVIQRKMPPWFGDSHFGDFANDRRLSDKDIETITAWIDGGAKEGNRADMPTPPQYSDGWQIGKPDLILSMKDAYAIPASGQIPWLTLPSEDYEFTEDVWVQAIEIRPGNRAAVHHATAQGTDGTEYLHLYSPGIEPMIWRDGYGKLIKKGTHIQFQMHYQATGKEQTDKTAVGFVFSKKPVHTQVHTTQFSNSNFLIPPMVSSHELISAFQFPGTSRIHSLRPHMHLRAQNDTTSLITPDGKRRVLLNQPKWDNMWQNFYAFSEAVQVTKGTILEYVANYDNSPANPVNPDPASPVKPGGQVEEEMHVLYLTFTEISPANINDAEPIQVSPRKAFATGLLGKPGQTER